MKEIFEFLDGVLRNNNRPWFQEHKDLYVKAQDKINKMAEQLIEGVSKFDEACKGLAVKDCTYRIYRDIRFSPDKRPYKTHIGVFVCPRGKKSGLAGYYFHLEPQGADYIGGSGLHVGMYAPEKWMVKSIREDLLVDGKSFGDAIEKAHNFKLNTANSLSKVPQGFPKDSPYAEYLKLKDYGMSQPITDEMLYSNHLIEWALDEFRTTYDFNSFLNRSAIFAMENENV